LALDTSTVYDLAAGLLDSVVTRMNAELTVDLPARQYVHAGLVAWDCEETVVAVPESGLTHAFPGEASKVEFCSPPRQVAFEVWIVRCVPSLQDNGTPPTEADLDAAAAIQLADLWTLSYVLWQYRDDWKGTCHTLLMGPVEIVGPEGTFAAVKATVFVLIT
jgi:hypothetical protein